ncbi:MAG: MarR family transcriptional regulator [Rhodobacteraceae bacterium]|nr:MarR family transcriptional regulator [Paracoccaceae bacterium]
MSAPTSPFPPRYAAGVLDRLAREGVPGDVAAALLELDSALFQWLRMAMKGEGPGKLVAELGLGLEPSQFFALTALTRIECGIGRAGPEAPTVGLLAEEMAIDPSRASRIAADLIGQGFLVREADQSDGRKTILRPTEKALSAMAAFRDLKWTRFLEIFRGWDEADITAFAGLFGRYLDGARRVYGLGPGADSPQA